MGSRMCPFTVSFEYIPHSGYGSFRSVGLPMTDVVPGKGGGYLLQQPCLYAGVTFSTGRPQRGKASPQEPAAALDASKLKDRDPHSAPRFALARAALTLHEC
jgi:hypothetical protein